MGVVGVALGQLCSLGPKYLFYKMGMGQSPKKPLPAPSWPVPPTSAAKGAFRASLPAQRPLHPSAAPSPIPSPGPRGWGQAGPLALLWDTATPALPSGSPKGPARQRGAGRAGAGGGRGRPARGRRRETARRQGAIKRRLRWRPLPGPAGSRKPNSSVRRRRQAAGRRAGGRGEGWQGGRLGGCGAQDSLSGLTLLGPWPRLRGWGAHPTASHWDRPGTGASLLWIVGSRN